MKVNKKSICVLKNKFFLIVFSLLFLSCNLNGRGLLPYQISGDITLEDSDSYSVAGLNLFFTNKSKSSIKDFTIVFYLFDEDGNPPSMTRNGFVIKIPKQIASDESVDLLINLDEYFTVIPDEQTVFLLDYLYVSSINYEDGSVYSDPFGMNLYY